MAPTLTARRYGLPFQFQTTMLIKIKTILWMIGLFFKEIYELLTGKRKWS